MVPILLSTDGQVVSNFSGVRPCPSAGSPAGEHRPGWMHGELLAGWGLAGHSSIFSPAKCFQSQLAGQPSPPKNRLFSPLLPQPPGSETTSNVGYPSPPVSPPCRSPQEVLDWVGFNQGPSLLPRPKSRCHPGVLSFVHLPRIPLFLLRLDSASVLLC